MVIFALVFSLIESKLILPTHLCLPITDKSEELRKPFPARWLHLAREKCLNGLHTFSEQVYQPILRIALQHKGSALIVFVVVMLGAYGSLMKGHISPVFFRKFLVDTQH